MPRGRHKKPKAHKTIGPVKAIALSLLLATMVVQPTTASFTDSSSASVSVKAAQWVTPSVATSGYNSATINWSPIPGYSSYIVQWAKTPEFDFPVSATVSGTSFSTTDLAAATTYYWRVKPADENPDVTWSIGIETATQAANGSVSFGDIAAYSWADKQFWNYGKTADNMIPANRRLLLSGIPAPSRMFVTDWNADGIEDVFLQTTSGMVEVYFGKPGGGFDQFNVGHSYTWNEYEVTVGRWLNHSKLPGILAIEKATGNLYYYENPTGGKHGTRTHIGTGWNGFTMAIIDFDNDGNQDIVARQPGTGDLLLYRSNGIGGFLWEERKVLGVGWNAMDSIGTVKDSEGPGTRGIIARQIITGTMYYYPILEDGTVGERRKFGENFGNFKISGS